ncbi:MAG: hypothetical protein KAW17_01830 [Candidatus Eisenbacteria sp.]|nr:hypothetical protein [Candidatus Eisenbacteria bacterium]
MDRRTRESGDVEVECYAVAYLDLLNQKDVLKKMARCLRDPSEKSEFKKLMQQSYGKVLCFRDVFEKTLSNHISAVKGDSNSLSAEQRSIIERLTNMDIRRQCFSDTIVYYILLGDRADRVPIAGVWSLLVVSAAVFMSALPRQLVFRGAIEAGLGMEFSRGDIYGPALSGAHALESHVARYPRIAIGNTMREYLLSESRATDPDGDFRQSTARECLSYIFEDQDGIWALDYLGQGMRRLLRSSGVDLEPIFKDAIEFAAGEAARFKNEGNEKLEKRYKKLRAYLEKCWRESHAD